MGGTYPRKFESSTIRHVDIHTWTTQGETLREYARDAFVLEIGAWKGASTINMAQVAKTVWAIDNFINLWTDEQNIQQQFIENVQKYGVADKVKLWAGDSRDILPKFKVTFDFIFVDGGHEFPVVNFDSEWSCKLIKPNGHIAWHDSDHPPVAAAIKEVTEKYPLTKVKEDGMLSVYQFRS